MHLIIHKEQLLKDIQAQFQQQYPFLKLEFFKEPHQVMQSTALVQVLDREMPVSKFSKSAEATLNIDPQQTVAHFEKEFQDKLGFAVQVFRKANQVWIETSQTDGWSLAKQNEDAEELLKLHEPKSWEQRLEDNRFDNE
jgi:hypothetical protein